MRKQRYAPYVTGSPVGNSHAFVGRVDVLRAVLRVLRRPQDNAVVLYGQRRIGKTSILQYLTTQLPIEGSYCPVYFDLQDKAALPVGQVLQALACTIAHARGQPDPALGSDPGRAFRDDWLPAVLDDLPDSHALVLLLDEFDVLDNPEGEQAGTAFFPYLRELLATDPERLQFVFVIGRKVDDLTTIARSLFKGTTAKRVSLLGKKDVIKLVRLSEANGTLNWSDEAVDHIWQLTHGHPCLTQFLCSQIWDQASEQELGELPTMSLADVDQAVLGALEAARNTLEWVWDGLPSAERLVASALASAGPGPIPHEQLEHLLHESGVRVVIQELQDAPRILKEWDLIEPTDKGYCLRVELMRRWISEQKPLHHVQEEIDGIDPEAENYYQVGSSHLKHERLEKAVEALRYALDLNPNHTRANRLLAQVWIRQNKIDEARQLLERLYEYQPATARPQLIQIYLGLAQAAQTEDEQLALYGHVLELDPINPEAQGAQNLIFQRHDTRIRQEAAKLEALYERAKLHIEHRRWEAASLLLEEIGEIAPAFKDAQELLERVREALREGKEERRQLQKLQFAYERALKHFEAGEWSEAIRFLEEVLSADSQYRDASDRVNEARRNQQLALWYKEAEQAINAGDWKQAIRLLQEAQAMDAIYLDVQERLINAQRQYKLTVIYQGVLADMDERRWDSALRGLEEIIEIDPIYRDVPLALRYASGQVAITAERWGEAVEQFSAVVQIDPVYRDVTSLLAAAKKQAQLDKLFAEGMEYLQSGDWNRAQSTFEQVVDIEPKYRDASNLLERAISEGRLAALYNRALRYAGLQRWAEAVVSFEKIVKQQPDYRDSAERLAHARNSKHLEELYRQGIAASDQLEWREAIMAFEQIVSASPDYRDAEECLQSARHQLALLEQYDRGRHALAEERWEDGIDLLEQVVAQDPNYLDAGPQLAAAKKQKLLSSLYLEGLQHSNSGSWLQAIRCFEQVFALAPTYRDAQTQLEYSRRQAEWERTFEDAQKAIAQRLWTQAHVLLSKLPRDFRDVGEMAEEAKRQQQLELDYDSARELCGSHRWAEAIPLLEQIIARQLDYRNVAQLLEEAKRQIELSEHYLAGMAAFQSANWDEAINYLDMVSQLDINYRDTLAKLTEARRFRRLAESYASGLAHAEAREWSDAIADFEAIVQIEPEYQDTKQKLLACKREEQLQQWYRRGSSLIEEKQWGEAASVFKQIAGLEEGYLDASDKLAQAESELQLAKWYDNGCRHLEVQRWAEAIDQFEKIEVLCPDYRDAVLKLQTARKDWELVELWSQAQRVSVLGQEPHDVASLEQVVQLLAKIVSIDETYEGGQPQRLLEKAQVLLFDARERVAQERAEAESQRTKEKKQRQERLESLHTKAVGLLDAGLRNEAVPILEEIIEIDPDFRDAARLLKKARRPSFVSTTQILRDSARVRLKRVQALPRNLLIAGSVAAITVVMLCVTGATTMIMERYGTPTHTPHVMGTPLIPSMTTSTGTAVSLASALTSPISIETTETMLPPTHTSTTAPISTSLTPTGMTGTFAPSPMPTSTSRPIASMTSTPSPSTPSPSTPSPSTPSPLVPRLTGKIAFPVYDPARKTYDVYLCNADGSGQRRVVTEASQPKLSPDGQKIAFRSWNSTSRGLIYASLDGSERFSITSFLEDARPDWAPNELIVFFSAREGDRRDRLYIDGAWETAETQLIQHGIAPAYGETPSWLGSREIVYSLCNPQCGIFVTDPNGIGPKRILDVSGKTAPAGSPDGRHIAFMSDQDGNWEIYVMNFDGSNLRQLTQNSSIDGLPTWSPDGSYIGFVSNRGGEWAIWAVHTDGTGLQKLFDVGGTIDGIVDGEPSYSSAGWRQEQISWSR